MFDTEIRLILAITSFSLGACVASFLNVVIWRVPRGESIVLPPSHCPKCNAPIRWYQNLPILSWLALGGKCANCREPISARYIFVEMLGGILFLVAFWKSWPAESPVWVTVLNIGVMWTWLSLMIVGTMIDFDHKLLPDFVTVGGIVLGVAESAVWTISNFTCGRGPSFFFNIYPILFSLCGLAMGSGLLWLIRYFGSKAFGREAMGMGDVLLMGAVGAMFGPIAVLFSLILSSLLGSLIGVSMLAFTKTRLGRCVEIPYGPYICIACTIWMFFGNQLVAWYLNLLRTV